MTTLKRLLVSTGDASGDIHGSHVIAQLQVQYPQLQIEAIGGPRIAATGVSMIANQDKMGVFGGDVLGAIPHHWALAQKVIKHLEANPVDAMLLIDYGVFHLQLAAKLKKRFPQLKLFYFIPPQVWASRPGRIKKIKQFFDHVFCIFPFEQPLYEKHNIPVTYVGHPLTEQITAPPDKRAFCETHGLNPELPIVGVFPGSRKTEIQRLLPTIIESLPKIEQQTGQRIQFVLAQSDAISQDIFDAAFAPVRSITDTLHFKAIKQQNHAIMALSRAAVVASGTVTLEAALYGTPMVIMYKIPPLVYAIGKPFILVPHIGLPNLLTENQVAVVPELFNSTVTADNIATAIVPFMTDTLEYHTARSAFSRIQEQLGPGTASKNVAEGLGHLIGLT